MMTKTQRGSSLIVGLVMLIMITLLVVSAFNATTTNQKIVYNAQLTSEDAAVGQTAIDKTLSNLDFMTKPITDPVNNTASWSETVGKFSPQMTANCLQGRILPNREAASLNKDCLWDPDTGGVFVEGKSSSASESLCAATAWDIQAATSNAFDNNAQVELHQGVEVKSSRDKIGAVCGF